ncbi:hypothetical protein MKW98_026583 [Papaver atlanticum]|uniref:Ethylene-insensitive protein 2 n=1 Tax=Papaver atlanticum TaxID=357466 RepID=A0AAD4RZI6_9MAGN|nr:hypothetical protein MKW98_026583 [Papaver atlanticum]
MDTVPYSRRANIRKEENLHQNWQVNFDERLIDGCVIDHYLAPGVANSPEDSPENMEAKSTRIENLLGTRLFQAVGPVLLISMGYIDPGKWAAVIEGGASFGFDLVLLLLVINCAAILCHYLAAHIGVVTGKNLAQIYNQEYDKSICLFFGVQAEISMVISDLTMVLGIAHGLNLLLGVEFRTSILLTAFDFILFPVFTSLLARCKTETYFIGTAGFVLLFYVFGVLMSQSEVPIVMNGMLTRFSGESAFVLMSLLGANVMPHNFYLYSSLVQKWQGPPNMSKSAFCHDHFVSILCIFSGIYLANYVLMSSAASFFYSADLVVLTFHDALLLMDQVLKSPAAHIAFFLLLFISSVLTGLTWSLGGQVVLLEFFRLDTPLWLHRTTIRLLSLVSALYCAGNSGAEGIYQLLIFSQVVLAMLLPSSVIPLFRVASSSSIMGSLKISSFLEFLTLSIFMGMLGLKLILVVEILFGSSDWVGTFRWNAGSSMTLPFVILLFTASVSLAFLVGLAITPLKSEGAKLEDEQMGNWEPSAKGEGNATLGVKFTPEELDTEDVVIDKAIGSQSDNSTFDFNSSDTVANSSDLEPQSIASEGICATNQTFPTCHLENLQPAMEFTGVEIADKGFLDAGYLEEATSEMNELIDPVPTTEDVTSKMNEPLHLVQTTQTSEGCLQVEEGCLLVEKDGDEQNNLEGPGSISSVSEKCEESIVVGSLSRLSGLGRGARRQLASILDEFWEQLFDLHGQASQKAKSKKLDILFRQNPNPAAPVNVGSTGLGASMFVPSVAERESEFLANPNSYDLPSQHRTLGSLTSSNGIQSRSPLLYTKMQLADAFPQSASLNVIDYGEKRYSSLHVPPSSAGLGRLSYQQSTEDDYRVASCYAQIRAEMESPNSLNGHLDSPISHSSSLGPPNYMDQLNHALSQKPLNRFTSVHATSMQNPAVSQNNGLNAEQSYYDGPYSSGFVQDVGSLAFTKKYHSLPRNSGLAFPRQGAYGTEKSLYGLYSDPGFSFSRAIIEGSLVVKSEATSPWSPHPFEQAFGGITGIPQKVGNGNSVTQKTNSHSELEALLLQLFRSSMTRLLKLEGSEWLFSLNGGIDEDLIDLVAARERFHSEAEAEAGEVTHRKETSESPRQYLSSDRKFGSGLKNDEMSFIEDLLSTVPNCGDGCIWKKDLIVSFGVWCIRRILELALVESRPELWGKYTYVLNRLQGILEPAFSKPRTLMPPCSCLQIPVTQAKRLSSPVEGGKVLPPAAKSGTAKCTTASAVIDIIKDVEIAVSSRKGRSGTGAGDVAFPIGKENLTSVLKRYKRRLSNKMFPIHEGGGRFGVC